MRHVHHWCLDMFQQMSPSPYSRFRMTAKSVAEKVEVGLAQNSNFRELRTARMLGYYREQDWTQALATIELCRKASELFGISALFDMYAERIEDFRRHPPPPDWNGVYEAESK